MDGTPVVIPGQQPMALEDTLRLAQEIVSAMAAAHAKGIIHRDLKPANILLSKLGGAKLLYFGIARQLEREGDATLTTLTGESVLIGTPAYMACSAAGARFPGLRRLRSWEAAIKALALDETDVEAHVALAIEERW